MWHFGCCCLKAILFFISTLFIYQKKTILYFMSFGRATFLFPLETPSDTKILLFFYFKKTQSTFSIPKKCRRKFFLMFFSIYLSIWTMSSGFELNPDTWRLNDCRLTSEEEQFQRILIDKMINDKAIFINQSLPFPTFFSFSFQAFSLTWLPRPDHHQPSAEMWGWSLLEERSNRTLFLYQNRHHWKLKASFFIHSALRFIGFVQFVA